MWICPRCAAHLPPDSVVCHCGARAPESIRAGCDADDRPPPEAPSLHVAAGVPNVERSFTRRAVEGCFKYGIMGTILAALLGLWGSWRSNDSEGLFFSVLLLLCSPLVGLVCALVGGLVCVLFTAIFLPGGDTDALPPREAMAKTDSLAPLSPPRPTEPRHDSSLQSEQPPPTLPSDEEIRKP